MNHYCIVPRPLATGQPLQVHSPVSHLETEIMRALIFRKYSSLHTKETTVLKSEYEWVKREASPALLLLYWEWHNRVGSSVLVTYVSAALTKYHQVGKGRELVTVIWVLCCGAVWIWIVELLIILKKEASSKNKACTWDWCGCALNPVFSFEPLTTGGTLKQRRTMKLVNGLDTSLTRSYWGSWGCSLWIKGGSGRTVLLSQLPERRL